jgi:integral membrane protein
VIALRRLRLIAILEGVSLLALVFVAMPLKYLAGLPLAVRIAGSVHGLLFLVFVFALFRASRARRWPIGRSAAAFVSSVVPFGMIFLDRRIQREIDAGAETAP